MSGSVEVVQELEECGDQVERQVHIELFPHHQEDNEDTHRQTETAVDIIDQFAVLLELCLDDSQTIQVRRSPAQDK